MLAEALLANQHSKYVYFYQTESDCGWDRSLTSHLETVIDPLDLAGGTNMRSDHLAYQGCASQVIEAQM